MKTRFTLLFLLFTFLITQAQVDIIRNGDFESNDGSGKITGVDHWYIDVDTSQAGIAGSSGDYNLYITGYDTASLYQVVDIVETDSMIYDVEFSAQNSWQSPKIVVKASTSDADSSVRTPYFIDSIDITGSYDIYTTSFSFAPASEYVGKKLILEFETSELGNTWINIKNIKLIKKTPGTNTKPQAKSGGDQKVTGGDLVTLDGSGSSDSDGDDLTYYWKSQFPGIILSDVNAVNPTFTAPEVEAISVYNFALWVNDGTVNSDTVYTVITVLPAGELIRNGDFKQRAETWETTNSIKDITYWNVDMELPGGGIWDLFMIHLDTDTDPLYQVVDKITADTSIYTLTFKSKTSWICDGINSIFSVSGADSSLRTQINVQSNSYDIDPLSDVKTSDWVIYTHTFAINAYSPHVGKNLIVEFQPTLHPEALAEDGAGWAQLEYVSLVKKVKGGGVGIKDNTFENLTLYPVPANGTLYISNEYPILEVDIFTLTGKKVKSITDNDIQSISVNGINTGLYLISIKTENGSIVKKLNIQ